MIEMDAAPETDTNINRGKAQWQRRRERTFGGWNRCESRCRALGQRERRSGGGIGRISERIESRSEGIGGININTRRWQVGDRACVEVERERGGGGGNEVGWREKRSIRRRGKESENNKMEGVEGRWRMTEAAEGRVEVIDGVNECVEVWGGGNQI